MRILLTFLLFALGVPAADVAGQWDFVWQTGDGERRSTVTITTDQEKVQAQFPDSKAPLNGTFKDNKLTLAGKLYSPEAGQEGEFQLSGEFGGDELRGSASWEGHPVTFTAKRKN